MNQLEIKAEHLRIYAKLKAYRKKSARKERDIIEEWEDLQEQCSHPDKQGTHEGYCPDCGWTFG